nr:MAG: hypothetical protein DiTV3a_F6ORF2 [Diabrotica toursvirus 3a]
MNYIDNKINTIVNQIEAMEIDDMEIDVPESGTCDYCLCLSILSPSCEIHKICTVCVKTDKKGACTECDSRCVVCVTRCFTCGDYICIECNHKCFACGEYVIKCLNCFSGELCLQCEEEFCNYCIDTNSICFECEKERQIELQN